jgi:hypothetical protein
MNSIAKMDSYLNWSYSIFNSIDSCYY